MGKEFKALEFAMNALCLEGPVMKGEYALI